MNDFKLNMATGDFVSTSLLTFRDGDFVIDESTQQHQRLLLVTHQGHWREKPSVGVGLYSYVNDENPEEMLRAIRQQFSRDGMRIRELRATSESKLKVSALYR